MMIKSSKYSFFRIFMVLCFAVMFSCTSVTTPTVETGKRKLATPTASITTREVDYGTVVMFSYTPNDANLFYTLDGTIPEVDGDSKYYNPNDGIKLDESCTITARIFHSNYEASDCVSFTYNVVLARPKLFPEKTDIDTDTAIS
ncbi:MAG: chitobiase/beta-hexosaminidase C-terminal domain-containing protein, partial [Spirochaetales bacterium]|nr:chitobiase/beta-hexosaminidase C-terminal domain-containing protein [Spirochaetales bacterium]